MKYFLLVFDRAAGRLLDEAEFESNEAALRERFRREATAGPTDEIVVLGAESAEALRKTHGRYFQDRVVVDVGSPRVLTRTRQLRYFRSADRPAGRSEAPRSEKVARHAGGQRFKSSTGHW